MDEDFEQNNFSTTAISTYRVGHDSIRLIKWMALYDQYHENLN